MDGYVLQPDEARRSLEPFRVLVDGAEFDDRFSLFTERGAYLAGLSRDEAPDPARMAEIYAAHASQVHGPPLLHDDH